MTPRADAGFNDPHAVGREPGPIVEAVYWAHGRRELFDLAEVGKAPLAVEAVPDRIGERAAAIYL